MNVDNKNPLMKKIIIANKIFIILQIALLLLSVIFNFVYDDAFVFLTVFSHIGIFVVYNIIVESMVQYGYIIKKYEKIYQEIHYLRYFKLRKCIYKSAKSNQDRITTALIIQSATKSLIAILNIILMVFMVNFE